jgi:DNA polymerase-3 subunit beta
LLRIIKDSEENMEIKVSRRYIAFNIGDSSFFSKTIDAEYIDYNRILPTKHTVVLKLKAEDLRGALERSSLIVEDRLAGSIRSYVKLTVEERLMVSTTSASGNVYDEINIEKESNGNIVIGFNCRFILDALRACDDGDVKMSFNNPLMGVLIEPQSSEDGKFLYFVMPIRMNS